MEKSAKWRKVPNKFFSVLLRYVENDADISLT